MGKSCCTVLEAMAFDQVASYALCLDMTARDMQDECKKELPWTLAKSFMAKKKIPDPHNLKLCLKVRGDLSQKVETSSVIFSISFIIVYISKIMTLEKEISPGHQRELNP